MYVRTYVERKTFILPCPQKVSDGWHLLDKLGLGLRRKECTRRREIKVKANLAVVTFC